MKKLLFICLTFIFHNGHSQVIQPFVTLEDSKGENYLLLVNNEFENDEYPEGDVVLFDKGTKTILENIYVSFTDARFLANDKIVVNYDEKIQILNFQGDVEHSYQIEDESTIQKLDVHKKRSMLCYITYSRKSNAWKLYVMNINDLRHTFIAQIPVEGGQDMRPFMLGLSFSNNGNVFFEVDGVFFKIDISTNEVTKNSVSIARNKYVKQVYDFNGQGITFLEDQSISPNSHDFKFWNVQDETIRLSSSERINQDLPYERVHLGLLAQKNSSKFLSFTDERTYLYNGIGLVEFKLLPTQKLLGYDSDGVIVIDQVNSPKDEIKIYRLII